MVAANPSVTNGGFIKDLQNTLIGAKIRPSLAAFLAWGVIWGVMLGGLLIVGRGSPDLAFGVAVGIGLTALLVMGGRLGWW